MMSVIPNDNVFLSMFSVVACVLSFISVFVSGKYGDGWTNNSYNVLDPCLREACMAAVFTVLCPTIGALVEYLPLGLPKAKAVGETDTQRQDVINSKLNMTLTLVEKSLYVMGILCLSVLYPTLPNTHAAGVIVRISVSFFNCSTTLMVCAILCFLCRRSTSFSLWNTRIMVVLVCVSGVINSCALMHDETPSTQSNVLFLVSNLLFDVATLIYAATCLHSFVRWFRLSPYGRRLNKVNDMSTKGGSQGDLSEEDAIKQLVVGTHMFSTFIVMTVNAVSIWFTPSLTIYQLSIIIYIKLATALLVFVFDSYAQFHILVAALWTLLDAKTDYVRYISHEVRTPLSATLMGLRMMLDDFKKSHPRPGSIDADRLDTLQDINSSCVSTLDILNDLLCFNKLEAGLLELHKESICPGTFVKESVAMFNVQARDSGVILSVVLNKPPSEGDDDDGNGSVSRTLQRMSSVGSAIINNTSNVLLRRGSSNSSGGGKNLGSKRDSLSLVCSRLLLETDTISLDKFKLDQVSPPHPRQPTHPSTLINRKIDEYAIIIASLMPPTTNVSFGLSTHFFHRFIGHSQSREQCHQVLSAR